MSKIIFHLIEELYYSLGSNTWHGQTYVQRKLIIYTQYYQFTIYELGEGSQKNGRFWEHIQDRGGGG